jgi:CRP/FNR family transcriptional regulator, cyclic AMP receptor protein
LAALQPTKFQDFPPSVFKAHPILLRVVKIDQTSWFGTAKVALSDEQITARCSFGTREFRRPGGAPLNVTARRGSCRFYSQPGKLYSPLTFPKAKDDMVREPTKDLFDAGAFLAKVGTGKTISVYRKDQVIFAQGEVADTIFYIQKGSVKIVVLSDQGKEAVIGILEAGQFFGEGCMNGHPLRIATSTAIEESLITAITKSAMIATLHNEPKFSELFVAYLLTRNSRVEDDLIDQLFNSSEKRLARLLLVLAKFGKEGSRTPISPNISQETLAEMIGTTRSRVSFFMNKFRKLGFISYNGKIEVHTSLLDAVLRDKPQLQRDEEADTP